MNIQEAMEMFSGEKINQRLLVLHNDNNTFEHVIKSLIIVCNHTLEQADQCAHLVHFKGECDVKRGSYEELIIMENQLIDLGLSVTIN